MFPKDDTLSLELALLKEYYGKGLIVRYREMLVKLREGVGGT